MTPERRRVAVVGSRGYPRLDLVRDYVHSLPSNVTVVSGGAVGVDETAEATARERFMCVRSMSPEWRIYGATAGLIRNTRIVEAADEVVAFWDGKSRGTMDVVARVYDNDSGGLVVGVDAVLDDVGKMPTVESWQAAERLALYEEVRKAEVQRRNDDGDRGIELSGAREERDYFKRQATEARRDAALTHETLAKVAAEMDKARGELDRALAALRAVALKPGAAVTTAARALAELDPPKKDEGFRG